VHSVVIATKDLKRGNRDIRRLKWQWVSLDRPDVQVLVIDGSHQSENKLIKGLLEGTTAEVIHRPQSTLNLPALWNYGVEIAAHDRILISGADFLYAPNFFEEAEKVYRPDRLTMCMCHALPNIGISEAMVRGWNWNWDKIEVFFKHNPRLANGIQYAHKDLFKAVPFDERMEKLGGMDNLQEYKCKALGYDCFWWEQSLVLHQWHPISRMKFDRQFEKNQDVIREFFKDVSG
jgi:hypothetical protein